MKLSIIIPVYNEQLTIRQVIEEVTATSLPQGMDRQIIIVNDGSTDQTGAILRSLQKNSALMLFDQPNRGKTAAIKRGLEAADGDFVIIQDGDLEYSPREYAKLLTPLLSGEATIVYGSRFLGTIAKMTWINFLANRLSNITFNALHRTHLTDINTCLKLLPRSILNDLSITSTDFTFETEITSKLINRGYHITEIPIRYEARSTAMGKKINPKKALLMYFGIFRYRKG